MLVAEAMNKNIQTARGDTPVKKLAEIMSENRIGSVIIVSGPGSLEGIVTERDIMSKVVATGKDPSKIVAENIMTKKVIAIDPSKTLEQAADVMTKYKIKKLPVIYQGQIVGIITASDLISYEEKLVEQISSLITSSKVSGIGG